MKSKLNLSLSLFPSLSISLGGIWVLSSALGPSSSASYGPPLDTPTLFYVFMYWLLKIFFPPLPQSESLSSTSGPPLFVNRILFALTVYGVLASVLSWTHAASLQEICLFQPHFGLGAQFPALPALYVIAYSLLHKSEGLSCSSFHSLEEKVLCQTIRALDAAFFFLTGGLLFMEGACFSSMGSLALFLGKVGLVGCLFLFLQSLLPSLSPQQAYKTFVKYILPLTFTALASLFVMSWITHTWGV